MANQILLFFTSLFRISYLNNSSNRKGISPVVATALLLVVAVVAVVGFQNWFTSYSSNIYTNTEQQSTSISNIRVDDLISGNTLYIYNGNENAVEILSVKSNNNNCYTAGDYTNGMNEIYLGDCITEGNNEISIVTTNGVITKKIYSDYSYSDPCPSGYILVEGNPLYDTKNFCVMKYEAKEDASGSCVGGDTNNCPISQMTNTPWVSITQTNAIIECESLGSNYHLITNEEWMTIARNAEQVSDNWEGRVVGTNFMYSGHNDNSPGSALSASTDDDYYSGTGNVAGSNQRRTLNLSNGEVIWDLAGNVWEWNDNTIDCSAGYPCANMPYVSSDIDSDWHELTAIDTYGSLSYDLLKPSNSLWDSTEGMGRIYTDANTASDGGTTHAFLRGGYWNYGALAGAFALYLGNGPSSSGTSIGFRCSYEP